MFSSVFSMISLSTPTSPNSFSITAMRLPWSSLRMRLSSVVLPAPRKPVRMVTGTICSCSMEVLFRRAAILPLIDPSAAVGHHPVGDPVGTQVFREVIGVAGTEYVPAPALVHAAHVHVHAELALAGHVPLA